MIEYVNVSKIFPNGTQALKNINLKINPGEFTFLVGPSGAGKTTLLRFLIREDLPTTGEVWFEDQDVVRLPGRLVPHLRRQVGMVFQDFKLLPRLTVFENVAFALEVAGRRGSEVREVVPYLLEKVGLLEKIRSFPAQLSSGEAQRVVIARALVHEPRVLLADEPTGNLDPTSSWEIIQLLNQINEWGTTVIMATHDSTIVDTLRKRVISIDVGEITRDDPSGSYSGG